MLLAQEESVAMFQSYKTRVARESFRTRTVRCVGSLSPYTPNLCIVSYSACETSPPKISFLFMYATNKGVPMEAGRKHGVP